MQIMTYSLHRLINKGESKWKSVHMWKYYVQMNVCSKLTFTISEQVSDLSTHIRVN